jgi:hypothetical protein
MPVARKRKIEVARLAGVGLVLAGLFALFLAIVSSQNAGAAKAAPRNAVLQCASSSDNAIGQAVQHGACETTTSTATGGPATPESSTTLAAQNHCGCGTTTTAAVTTTTWHHCGCGTTTTSQPATTTTLGEQGGSSSTLPNTTTTGYRAPTTTTQQGAPVTQGTQGSQGGGPTTVTQPVAAAEAASAQQLPFTGSPGLPLAGLGLLLIATGLALSVRRRRLAR